MIVKAHPINYRKFWISKFVDGINIRDSIEPYFNLLDEYGNEYFVLEESAKKIYCSTRLCSYLIYILNQCQIQLDISELSNFFGPPLFDVEGTDLSFLYEEKIPWINKIVQRSSGLIQLPTGEGKTELMTAIIKSWRDSGNILIMANRNAVCETIKERLFHYGVIKETESDDYYEDLRGNKVMIINPPAFCRSWKIQDVELLDLLRNVNLVLIDECESIPSSVELLLEQHCIKDKYIYGFSASADKYEGRELLSTEVFTTLNYDTYCVMYYVGDSTIFKEPAKEIHLKVFQSPSDTFSGTANIQDGRLAIEAILFSVPFSKYAIPYLISYFTNSSDKTLYIPCTITEHVDWLFSLFEDANVPAVHWTASGIYYKEDYISQEDLTEKVATHEVKVVISTQTSWWGVSMKFTDILLFIGSKYNVIIQTIGRTFRIDEPTVWILNTASSNNVFRRAALNRLEWVQSVYPIKSCERIVVQSTGNILTFKE